VWHLAVSSFFTGIFIAFLMPAQQAIVSDLVERRTLMNAVSLDALGMGMMGVFSASLAGLVIEHTGVAGVYYLMAGMYLTAMYTIYKLPKTEPREGERTTMWADLIAGARYLGGNTTLLLILGLGLVRVFFVMPYIMLLPAFARDNLGFDAVGLGLLQSAAGVGAMIASLVACTMGDMRHKGWMLLGAGLALGACLLAFVTVPWLPLVFVFLALVGGFSNLYMVASNTLLLSYSDAAYRGRVLSIGMMEFGLTPVGTIPAGFIADQVGVPWVVGVQGVVVTLAFLAAGLLRPQIRRMD
jgi:MFS family permease